MLLLYDVGGQYLEHRLRLYLDLDGGVHTCHLRVALFYYTTLGVQVHVSIL